MACGKLFLLREKSIALVKQDKWMCPLPPAPEGELTENSIRIHSSFSSAATVVNKGKIKSQPRERGLHISCWFLFIYLLFYKYSSLVWLHPTEMGKKKNEGWDLCLQHSVAF